jgi:hypothetical protein
MVCDMIIEQIRYYTDEATLEQLLGIRREVGRLRQELGLPPGFVLIADPPPDDGPAMIWQCGYEDESEMGLAEAKLIGNTDYESARSRLAALAMRVELELYMSDEG